jgi:tetratricopeptide (TPR) repeat protein
MRKKALGMALATIGLLLVGFASYTYRRKCISSEKLIVQYNQGLKVAYNKDNFFCSEAQLAYYDSILATSNLTNKLWKRTAYSRGITLLKLGREQEAINTLQKIVDSKDSAKQDYIADDARKFLAIAFLRLGEKNNCVSQHTTGSCLFPIRGNGIYMDPSAPQKAINTYGEILRKDPDDLESRWLLNISYMTIGGYPKDVPLNWLIPGLDLDTSSYKINPFQDLAGTLSLNKTRNMAGGCIVDDFDNDGYLDIVTSAWGLDESMHYFRNNADGTFTDLSAASGLKDIKGGLNIIQADYNNDGYTDILVLRGAWLQEFGKQPKTLLRNNGNGTFTDVTIESGLISLQPTQTATWADFNNDGWLDLFIANETVSPWFPHPTELFISNQDGTFTKSENQSGCAITGFFKGVTSADYNNDGWPDIFISSLDGNKVLFKNKGVKGKIPQFENVTLSAGLQQEPTNTFPTWFWDYDNDGWPDIFACGYQFQGSIARATAAEALNQRMPNISRMYLYRNNQDGTFSDVSKRVGLNHPVFGMGSNFGDIDNDGWLDMYIGTGNPDFRSLSPNRMFKNIGGQTFADVTKSARVGNLQKGHAIAWADIDNDGDQDIFAELGGAVKGDAYYNSLFINPGQNKNRWISLLLEGDQSNRSAIGARIVLSFVENGVKRTVYSDVNSGGSFGASPLRKEIGIGSASMIDELIIKWPTTGNVQVFKHIVPCQFLKIKEGSNRVTRMDIHPLVFAAQTDSMKMVICEPQKLLAK